MADRFKAPILKFGHDRPDISQPLAKRGRFPSFSRSRKRPDPKASQPVLSRSVANPVADVRWEFSLAFRSRKSPSRLASSTAGSRRCSDPAGGLSRRKPRRSCPPVEPPRGEPRLSPAKRAVLAPWRISRNEHPCEFPVARAQPERPPRIVDPISGAGGVVVGADRMATLLSVTNANSPQSHQ